MKTRLAAALVAMLGVTGLVAAPAGAASTDTERIGGFVVTWPSDSVLDSFQPGDAVRVSVAPSARARAERRVATVSLARVTRSGKLLMVARRRLRSGSIVAKLPRDGLYRLQVTTAKGYVRSTFEVVTAEAVVPCAADQGYEAELDASQTVAQPGDQLTVTLTNTGTTCLAVSYGLSWQVLKDGRYSDVSFGVVYPATVLNLAPGERQVQQVAVPANTPPGEYRAVKSFADGNGLTAEVTVTR